jgi:hypothetical protein
MMGIMGTMGKMGMISMMGIMLIMGMRWRCDEGGELAEGGREGVSRVIARRNPTRSDVLSKDGVFAIERRLFSIGDEELRMRISYVVRHPHSPVRISNSAATDDPAQPAAGSWQLPLALRLLGPRSSRKRERNESQGDAKRDKREATAARETRETTATREAREETARSSEPGDGEAETGWERRAHHALATCLYLARRWPWRRYPVC